MAFDFANFHKSENSSQEEKKIEDCIINPIYSIKNTKPCHLKGVAKDFFECDLVDYYFHCSKIIEKNGTIVFILNYFLRDSKTKDVIDHGQLMEIVNDKNNENKIYKDFSNYTSKIMSQTDSKENNIIKFDNKNYSIEEYEKVLKLWNKDQI